MNGLLKKNIEAWLNTVHGQLFLNIGMGDGFVSEIIAQRGKRVFSTSLSLSHIALYRPTFNQQVVFAEGERLPFRNDSFDVVIASHVLEHSRNPGIFLDEIWRVLKIGGLFFVAVPPYKNTVVGGHIHTGWNVGQLLYILLINGFNVRNGSFYSDAQNVIGVTSKMKKLEIKLNFDFRDIALLHKHRMFPDEIQFSGDEFLKFDGNIKSINWLL